MRREPYTVRGLRRIACARCGQKPSYANWNICADDGRVRGICAQCDIGLNEVAMRFVFGSGREDDLAAYRQRVETAARG